MHTAKPTSDHSTAAGDATSKATPAARTQARTVAVIRCGANVLGLSLRRNAPFPVT